MRDAVEAIIAAAPKVLWLADGDTWYGNAISVQKTIRAYARAGAAAVLSVNTTHAVMMSGGSSPL